MKVRKLRIEERLMDLEEIKVALVGYFNLPIKKDPGDKSSSSIRFVPDIQMIDGINVLRGIKFVVETVEEVKEVKNEAN